MGFIGINLNFPRIILGGCSAKPLEYAILHCFSSCSPVPFVYFPVLRPQHRNFLIFMRNLKLFRFSWIFARPRAPFTVHDTAAAISKPISSHATERGPHQIHSNGVPSSIPAKRRHASHGSFSNTQHHTHFLRTTQSWAGERRPLFTLGRARAWLQTFAMGSRLPPNRSQHTNLSKILNENLPKNFFFFFFVFFSSPLHSIDEPKKFASQNGMGKTSFVCSVCSYCWPVSVRSSCVAVCVPLVIFVYPSRSIFTWKRTHTEARAQCHGVNVTAQYKVLMSLWWWRACFCLFGPYRDTGNRE